MRCLKKTAAFPSSPRGLSACPLRRCPASRETAWPCLLLFIASVGFQGCGGAQQQADDDLASRITRAVLASDELNLSRIEVSVEDGTVYLSGMADDHESKSHAEKEASNVPGVKKIINKIEVDF